MRVWKHTALAVALLLGLAGARPAAAQPTIGEPPVPKASVAAPLADAADGELALPEVQARGRILVKAQAGLGDVAARLAGHADGTLAAIADDLPDLPVPARVEIRLVHDSADLARAAPPGRGAPVWAAGVAYPDVGVLVVAMRRGGQLLDVDQTTAHELAHLALGAALGDRAPRWLHEGFAWQHSPDLGWERNETLAGMAWFGSAIPLGDLDLSFPAAELPAARAYAESYDFVGFLAHRGRWDDRSDDGDRWPFRRFLRTLAASGDVDAAAVRAYGRPIGELFEEWHDDLRSRFLLFPAVLAAGLLWVVAALLLVLAFLRRRRQKRRRLGEWGEEERRAAAAARQQPASVAPPAFVAWPGQTDPLAEPEPTAAELAATYPDAVVSEAEAADGDDDDDDPQPPERRWVN